MNKVQIYSKNKVKFAVGLRGFHQYFYVKASRVSEMVQDCFL